MRKPSLTTEVFLAALLVGGCSKSVDRAAPAPESATKPADPAVSAAPVAPLAQPTTGAITTPVPENEKPSTNTAATASAAKPAPKATKPGAQASCGQGTCGPDMKQK